MRAHLAGKDDEITCVAPGLARTGDFSAFLAQAHDDGRFERLRRAEIVGRPIGSKAFLETLEKQLDRRLQIQKPGRKKSPESI